MLFQSIRQRPIMHANQWAAMSISADNKTRACQSLPEKIFYLHRPSRFPYLSSPAGHGSGPIHHQIIHIHLQESKTIRRNPGYSNPLSQHWDHIITTSITRRTVWPWLVMMMTSRDTGFNGMGALSLCIIFSDPPVPHHMAGHCQTRQRLPNAREQEATNRGHQGFLREGLEPDAKQKMRVSNPLHRRGRWAINCMDLSSLCEIC